LSYVPSFPLVVLYQGFTIFPSGLGSKSLAVIHPRAQLDPTKPFQLSKVGGALNTPNRGCPKATQH